MGIEFEKQISYWIGSATEDFEVAKILIEKKRYLHGLFFCHLVVEKSLKAIVVKITQEFAPKSHNLIYLAEKSKIELSEKQLEFFGILMKYQLEGRYPGYSPRIPLKKEIENYLLKTKESLEWLKLKL